MKSWQLNQAARVISAEGILAYPTEAVYGLGCSPYSQTAVRRILQLKGRKVSKGLILIGSEISQFRHLVNLDVVYDRPEILASWPGPVTWIIPAQPGVSAWLTGNRPGLAVRISNHPLVRGLCNRVGLLVSTSANPSGCEPAKTAIKVRTYFGNKLDFIMPGQLGNLSGPTEIRDAVSGRIMRPAS